MKRPTLLPIILTVFVDLVGFGIVIPILAPLLISPDSPVFSPDTPFAVRTITLGVIMGIYPLAQFFGAPILGVFSDRHGRRWPLLFTVLVNAICYALFAVGISTGALWLIIGSRVLAGFTGGNLSIAYSAIADISREEDKSRNFGLVGMAFGLGFIIGPIIGGLLSGSGSAAVFGAATPFWFAFILGLVNVVIVYVLFAETLKARVRVPMSLLTGLHNLRAAFTMPNVRIMFLVMFLLTFGFTAFTNFFQVFLIDKFQVTETQTGLLFGWIGIWIAFTQGLLMRFIPKRIVPASVLKFSVLCLSVSLIALLLPKSVMQMFLVIPLVSVFQGLTQPNSTAVISDFAGAESQGEIMGINQSVQSMAMAIPALAAGALSAYSPSAPIVAAAAVTLMAWLVFVFAFDAKRRTKFREVA